MTAVTTGRRAAAAMRGRPVGAGTAVALDASPTALYEEALRSADGRLWVSHSDGQRDLLPVPSWRGGLVPGDASLLRRCAAPTLDVGCGPGRLVAALATRGVLTLGIDVAPYAVRLARRAGAPALCRDVFDRLPGQGRWSRLLLADGNIGIGGDPGRLLARAAEILSATGQALVELQPPAVPSGRLLVRLEGPDGRVSRSFPWAFVGPGEIHHHASAAGLRVAETWSSAGRHFAALSRA
ncbi:class I SAM-dependent methyltransferase [Pseudofrankia inefficax]|uniref:Methyltransferase type 11 n=1 Tax=Pseudofrankia inefficax (strain DSM 45817 / CECT 9037 / DDB 130130 / EuI1c) TaxID=298654 RepID=E3J9D1_PSEI1|nr:class I SAM-dependent methyltransferase [Pseudofrankia inefficax]ADP82150.1 Methyltransferase type 11 [Pseudofrankia inefficax]